MRNSSPSGSVRFEYDSERNIVFTEDHWEVKTKTDVEAFFSEYLKYFQALGKKVYMISDIDDLRVHAEVAEYYGETARSTIGQYLLGFARYGKKDLSRMTVRTSSLKAKLPSNIYSDREAAVQAVEEMKKEKSGGEAV
jgi:hypothetical protein